MEEEHKELVNGREQSNEKRKVGKRGREREGDGELSRDSQLEGVTVKVQVLGETFDKDQSEFLFLCAFSSSDSEKKNS